MKKNWILILIVFVITSILLNVTYAETILRGGDINPHSLLSEFLDNDVLISRIIILQILFPLIFSIESFLITYPFTRLIRILFVFQSILAFWAVFSTHFLMTFYLFIEYHQYNVNTFSILAFEAFFGVWSMLLAIGVTSKIGFISYFFRH